MFEITGEFVELLERLEFIVPFAVPVFLDVRIRATLLFPAALHQRPSLSDDDRNREPALAEVGEHFSLVTSIFVANRDDGEDTDVDVLTGDPEDVVRTVQSRVIDCRPPPVTRAAPSAGSRPASVLASGHPPRQP